MTATSADLIVIATLSAGVGAGAGIDIYRRRIPNVVSFGLAAAGMTCAAAGLSHVTLAASVLGLVLGLAVMLPGHVLGALGAGDVKLFAAAGAVLGAERVIPAFVYTAIAGGVFAIAIAASRGRLVPTITRAAAFCREPRDRTAIEAAGENNKFPYGPAIAMGCLSAAVWSLS